MEFQKQIDLLSEQESLLRRKKELIDKEINLINSQKIRIEKKMYNILMKNLRKLKYSQDNPDHVKIIKKTYPIILFQIHSLGCSRFQAIEKVAKYLYYDISYFGRILCSRNTNEKKK